PGTRYSATRDGIRKAVVDLVDAAKDQVGDVFVLCSGHGFRVSDEGGTEDVLVAADFDGTDGGKCIRLQYLHAYLVRAIGPGAHFWFVDACRLDTDLQPSDNLGLAPRTSSKGSADPYDLFATAPDAPARKISQFPQALVAGLH